MTQGHLNHTALNVSTISPPPDCLVLPYLQYMPWDNPSNIISAHAEHMVQRWKDAVLLPFLFLIGAPANVINMAVFRKQGLKERINVCLFALSLADFLFLLQIFVFHAENMDITRKERYGEFDILRLNHNMSGFYSFTWVSQVLSAIIASERCFCVLWPLRSRTILRTSTTTVIIVVINVTIVGLYFFLSVRMVCQHIGKPFALHHISWAFHRREVPNGCLRTYTLSLCASEVLKCMRLYRIGCVYDPKRGVSFMSDVIGDFYSAHRVIVDLLYGIIYGMFLPISSMVIVVIATIVTAIKLREAAAWRSGTSSASDAGSGSGSTSREIALTKMLVCCSVLFIVCFSPVYLYSLALLFLPELSAGGRQHNLYLVGIYIMDVFCTFNSTFNFFIYYSVGSRYRDTFWQLVRRGKKEKGKVKDTRKEKTTGNSQISS